MRHLLVLLLPLAAACAQWKAQTRPIPEVLNARPAAVLVTRHDGSTVTVVDPVVVDSSVVGAIRRPDGRVDRGISIQVAFADIASLATWERGRPTIAQTVGATVGAFFLGSALTCLITGCGF